jgi:hypothetical protein
LRIVVVRSFLRLSALIAFVRRRQRNIGVGRALGIRNCGGGRFGPLFRTQNHALYSIRLVLRA